jgi:guanylate kinase
MKQLLITLTGRSGCGKSSIAERLNRRYGYIQAKSYTTRPMRDSVEDANTHTFITRGQIFDFKDDIVAYNEYNDNAYFVTRTMLEGC